MLHRTFHVDGIISNQERTNCGRNLDSLVAFISRFTMYVPIEYHQLCNNIRSVLTPISVQILILFFVHLFVEFVVINIIVRVVCVENYN